MQPVQLIIFAKAPRAGFVKTRLGAEIGDGAAVAAHRRMLDLLVGKLELPEWRIQLRFAPDDAGEELRSWLRPGWSLQPQGPGDLGERMGRAIEQSVAEGHRQTIVIGSDCPYLEVSDLVAAAAALEAHDVVLGPAEDGGYWLIGLRTFRPELFGGIPWSTDEVFACTLARAQEAGLKVGLLRSLADVDTAADWRRFLGG